MPATNPDNQNPEYLALAAASRNMLDAFATNNPGLQREAAQRLAAALNDPAPDDDEILGSLRMVKDGGKGRCTGGRWVKGTIARHAFEALVFPEHAEVESYELGGSRISKLWLRDQITNQVVCEFDRGWSIEPTTPAAKRITDLLAAGLAETVFGR